HGSVAHVTRPEPDGVLASRAEEQHEAEGEVWLGSEGMARDVLPHVLDRPGVEAIAGVAQRLHVAAGGRREPESLLLDSPAEHGAGRFWAVVARTGLALLGLAVAQRHDVRGVYLLYGAVTQYPLAAVLQRLVQAALDAPPPRGVGVRGSEILLHQPAQGSR